ncbi:ATP-binding protein [Pedobacter sp. SYSU D00535]|uniref:PAS domain-containing hybrid sensor histidine kinase/response regulator n=1 Tax=Pedobacter sp. SYSU D00535 TaxID=2810308 RepID=UPI001A96109C|nr:ATP-binding protein [Pedobacter sp. SYSU D00535]
MNSKSRLSIVGVIILLSVVLFSSLLVKTNYQIFTNTQVVLKAQDTNSEYLRASSALGNVQENFKSFVLAPNGQNRDKVLQSAKVFQKALHALSQAVGSDSTLRASVDSLSFYFKLKQGAMLSQLSRLAAPLDGTETLRFFEENNSDFNILWLQLEEINTQQKKLLATASFDTQKSSLISLWTALVGSIFIISVFLWGFLALSQTFKNQLAAQRKEQESNIERRKHEQLLQLLINNNPSVIYIKDTTGRYTLVNDRFRQLMNLRNNQIIGKHHSELVSGNYVQYDQQDETEILSKGQPAEALERVVIYREKRDFLTYKFPLRDEEGLIFGIAAIATDVTDRKRYEDELKKARHLAEEAKVHQERFLANMSHEIRTPVNNVIGITNLLDLTTLNKEQQEYVSIIRQSSNLLIAIVNDILDLSKIRSGLLDVERISIDVSSMVRQLLLSFRPLAEEKRVMLKLDLDPTLPGRVLGDPTRLSQIISNLLSNAIKFTGQGGIVELLMRSQYKEKERFYISFMVRDTGIGIPKNKLEAIFESFTQSSASITREYGGTGLGLTIVKELVDLLAGTITVESEPGKGSTFEVKIPFTITTQPIAENMEEETSSFDLCLSGKKILVVEDNLLNQSVVRQTLQKAGVEVEVADNGFVALFLLKQKKFDLVLMDMQMDDMDGLETTRQIRKDLKLSTPVIALTASAMIEDEKLCYLAGMNEFITKPFVADDLLRKINNVLNSRNN